ncbi:type II toxin-antitoxin system HicB family antitoxin [Anaerobacillus alkaliphilus]|uniref:Type II toxin-antitoxin system HicB family antitoxin n=1 Tax=Anaerobacillus alkaliphilus TaxID=1548597 RepID=A0A4Q0VQZ1_9BACI|nr:type II toxin-antitoxin system HicB family antitoxin [Anaerobacillus alkaliphilus]RXI98629.1 type II toxin-antitoxin system HicB family antitoxin [Anaerobacillus alkaliphilus]
MEKHVLSEATFCPMSYTWIVQKQLSCYGETEYMIEIKELDGCVSYGATYGEARAGLGEAIQIWFKHRNEQRRFHKTTKMKTHFIQLEPKMTKEEFEQINRRLLKLLLK